METIVDGGNPSVVAGKILYKNKSLRSGVKLFLNTVNIPTGTTAFSATCKLKLEYYNDSSPTTLLTETISLTVNFDSISGVKYKNIDVVYVDNVYKLKATLVTGISITSGTLLPANSSFISMQAFTEQERFGNLDNVFGLGPSTSPFIPSPMTFTPISAADLLLSWTSPGFIGEGFEVEYTFLDDYGDVMGAYLSPSAIDFTFRHNSTKVLVQKNSLIIPIVFEHGYLVARIRGYGMAGPEFNQIFYSNYHPSVSGSATFNLATYPYKWAVAPANVHTGDKINWQSVTTFAEEAKRKTVVKYLDGTMRERQVVTNANSDNTTIVGETIYDFQGRPAVNVLPVPVYNKKLQYYSNFNRNESNTPYSWQEFDIKGIATCDPFVIKPMKNEYGASLYYSEKNPNKATFNAYIPDAEGYPFTTVKYMPDPTDRVVRQGSVGKLFQPGKSDATYHNHDTKYYYGKPEQDKLDMLFGTNVGFSEFYQKNLVVDANGQVSVSYVDLDGKTIATALAGEAPASLDTLEGIRPMNINKDLLSSSDLVDNIDHSITSTESFLVAANGTVYNFNYELNEQTYLALSCADKSYCLDCIYDLEIALVNNECSNVEYTKKITVGNLTSLNFRCNDASASTVLAFNKTLNIGSYSITKKLTVNDSVAKLYVHNILNDPANTCIKTFDDFYEEAWAKRDTNRCKEACEACKAEASALTGSEYTAAMNACQDQWCDASLATVCDVARYQMINDLTPGGQYAEYLDPSGNYSRAYSPISIFSTTAIHNIRSALSSIRGINVIIPGLPTRPLDYYLTSDAGLDTLVNNWPDDLSEKLLELHPEYCYLKFCSEPHSVASQNFDDKLMKTASFADATAAGFITRVSDFYNIDPFYTTQLTNTPFSGTYKPEFKTKFDNFGGPGINIVKLALFQVNCPSATSIPCPGSPVIITTDEEWNMFKMLYFSLKQEFVEKARQYYVFSSSSPCCTNDFIGCIADDGSFSCPIIPDWPSYSSTVFASTTNKIYYGHADIRFNSINDIKIPGLPSPPSTSYYNMDDDDLKNLITNAASDPICPTCSELEAFKGMIAAIQTKGWIKAGAVKSADEIPGLEDKIRKRMLGSSYPTGNFTFNHTSDRKFTISTSSCTLTFTCDSIVNWDKDEIVPTCLGIADYKNAKLHAHLSSGKNVVFTVTSTCEIFYCSGQKPQDGSTDNDCICKDSFKLNQTYEVGSIVNYENKCYLLSKGNSHNTLNPGVLPTNTSNWKLLCEKLPICKDPLNLNFDTDRLITSDLSLASSDVIPNKYKVSNRFSSSLGTKTFSSNVLLAYPVSAGQVIFSKTVPVQSGKTYAVTFEAELAFDGSPASTPLSAELMLNSGLVKTIPAFSTTWIGYSANVNTASSTSLEIKLLCKGNGKDVIAIDNVKVICIGDTEPVSSGSRTASSSSSSPEPRYIPEDVCGCDELCNPKIHYIALDSLPCDSLLHAIAMQQATDAYAQYLDSLFHAMLNGYYTKCLKALETFQLDYVDKEYHYTLYYYDQSGNLVRTVPPAGVKPLGRSSFIAVRNSRKTNGIAITPNHIMPTTYRHNGLNSVVWQMTPDAGISEFYYDKLGRIVLSQNAVQKPLQKASYTYFDNQGRNIEVGQMDVAGTSSLYNVAANYSGWPVFVQSRNRDQITFTYYDKPASLPIANAFGTASKNYLRNRIGTIASYALHTDIASLNYTFASHYRYDISGNVTELLQDYGSDSPFGNTSIRNQSKKLSYDFDLISGKVNKMTYEAKRPDQFIYKYKYDADNRLTDAFSSKDGVLWERDAHYLYYLHGPIARAEIGTDNVQGIDYAYNLQGWIKGINALSSDFKSDMGQDGSTDPYPTLTELPRRGGVGPVGYGNGIHSYFASDAASYWLSYYKDDYKPIGITSLQILQTQAPLQGGSYYTDPFELYNGNIRSMYTNLKPFGALGMKYRYDQLNRIKYQDAYKYPSGVFTPSTDYKMALTYDANGNIKTLSRSATGARAVIDDLKYNYYNYNPATGASTTYSGDPTATYASNRLAHVDDRIGTTPIDDIEDQNPNNYTYDAIGNLTKDVSEGISNISWNLQNKITVIQKTTANITYDYDVTGKRIMKKVASFTGTPTEEYSVLDAQGNTIATYLKSRTGLIWQGQHLYGSSRLGIVTQDTIIPTYMGTSGTSLPDLTASGTSTDFVRPTFVNSMRGKINYEITNHLSNVLATVSDAKKTRISGQITNATDYYAFGMAMPGRTLDNLAYRYGMNGQQKDLEIFNGANSAEFWEYDSRIGRRWNIDPVVDVPISGYATFADNPILLSDMLGNKPGDDDPKSKKVIDKKNSSINFKKAEDGTYLIEEVPIYGEKIPKPNQVKSENSLIKKVSSFFNALGNELRELDDFIANSHDGSEKTAVKTGFHGIQETNNGGNKNIHALGLPDFNTEGGNPGSNLLGSGRKSIIKPKSKILEELEKVANFAEGTVLLKEQSNKVEEEVNKYINKNPKIEKLSIKWRSAIHNDDYHWGIDYIPISKIEHYLKKLHDENKQIEYFSVYNKN
jgi:hypothetical protein